MLVEYIKTVEEGRVLQRLAEIFMIKYDKCFDNHFQWRQGCFGEN